MLPDCALTPHALTPFHPPHARTHRDLDQARPPRRHGPRFRGNAGGRPRLVGNADQGRRRQVTLIDEDVWRGLMDELGADAPPSARRANLMVRGIDLRKTRERVLRIGACRVRIRGETRPCERMDEAVPGLRDAMREHAWSGGAFAEVLDDGVIRVGDPVRWEDESG